jgi:hypothetical protein
MQPLIGVRRGEPDDGLIQRGNLQLCIARLKRDGEVILPQRPVSGRWQRLRLRAEPGRRLIGG